jgi:uncharacterized phiE125 gp8 family phage protein
MRWSLIVTTAAAAQPVSLDEAKAHLRVDSDDEDDLITSLIEAATDLAEQYCRRAFMPASFRLGLDRFPAYDIRLPRNPVISVDSITYLDEGGTERTLSASEYLTDLASEPARITPTYGNTWPTTRGTIGAVKVNFTAGYSGASPDRDSVPEGVKAAIKLLVADFYQHRSAQSAEALEKNPAVVALLSRFRLLSL